MATPDYEKLGVFYLGRRYDLAAGRVTDEPILYDAKDLTTHAVCVGMTGSGKTGLGIALLEEAAIDGIPVLAIDPKGDLANLMLTFPQLRPADFRPWIDAAEAARRGHDVDEEARATAELWRRGLAEWDQTPERIARFAASCERVVYTPGSRAGRPLSILRSFDAPPLAVCADEEALRERITGAVSGLLGLLGLDADPLRSREPILLATLFDTAWRAGQSLDLGTLVRQIQRPPFDRVGVMDLESFYPAQERMGFAMAINNLLASPGFSAWTEGEPLDVERLLFTEDGRPKLSIVSIAHLSDPERMLVVTLLLSQLVAWMRGQPGSRTLRALLYMDEVFGYFPPVANPPSKLPMLTLLKQGRAFGVGCVLATQNPADLDYKGLSNAGTWFLGRLQTERDKARVIEGLEGASAASGAHFDRAQMEETLAGLGARVFLMNNVHEDAPVVFHTRWVLSYLAGPLTREQLRSLLPEATPAASAAPSPTPPAEAGVARRPVVPAGIAEGFLPVTRVPSGPGALVYRPALLGAASLHYASAPAGVDEWQRVVVLAPLGADVATSPWAEGCQTRAAPPALLEAPEAGARFEELPPAASRAASYERWRKMLVTHLYRSHPLVLRFAPEGKLVSRPGESEAAFRGRLRERVREERDLAVEKLRKRHAPKLAQLAERIARAEQRVAVEQEQYQEKRLQSVISIGASVLGAVLGRKLASTGNVGRATTAARGIGRAARERGDIARAEERVETLREQLAALEGEFQEEVSALERADAQDVALEQQQIAPRKSDLEVEPLQLVWMPWRVAPDGTAEPLFEP